MSVFFMVIMCVIQQCFNPIFLAAYFISCVSLTLTIVLVLFFVACIQKKFFYVNCIFRQMLIHDCLEEHTTVKKVRKNIANILEKLPSQELVKRQFTSNKTSFRRHQRRTSQKWLKLFYSKLFSLSNVFHIMFVVLFHHLC
jgi:hypothetical protein